MLGPCVRNVEEVRPNSILKRAHVCSGAAPGRIAPGGREPRQRGPRGAELKVALGGWNALLPWTLTLPLRSYSSPG